MMVAVVAVVAHAGGMGWDEALLFALPVVVLVVLQVIGRRRAKDAGVDDGGRGEGSDDDDHGAGAGGDAPVRDAP